MDAWDVLPSSVARQYLSMDLFHMKPCRRQVLIGGNMIQSHAAVVQGFAVSLQHS